MESQPRKKAIIPSDEDVNLEEEVDEETNARGTKRKTRREKVKLWEIREQADKRWIDEHMTEDVDLDQHNTVVPETAEPPADLIMPILRYQREFLAWATKQEQSVKGGILADEKGMGKTIQAISLVLARVDRVGVGFTLVICPIGSVSNWSTEIGRFTSPGSTNVLVYYGPKREKNGQEFKKYDFVLTTYGIVVSEFWMRSVQDLYDNMNKSPLHSIKWNRIILDEAHDNIKGGCTSTARAVCALDATYRWTLSGTPIQNRVEELYNLVHFLRIFPYSYDFCMDCDCRVLEYSVLGRCNSCTHTRSRHFCWWYKNVEKPISLGGGLEPGKRAMILLNHKVLKDILIRRTKVGRAVELARPPRVITLRRDALDRKEFDYYESLSKDIQAQFNTYYQAGTLMSNFTHIFALLTHLRRAVNHPYLVVCSRSGGANGENKKEHECGICHDLPEENVVTSCAHVFCKSCLIGFFESLGKARCPTCSKRVTMDWTTKAGTEQQASKTKVKGFGARSILNRINLDEFQTSTKIEALREEIRLMIERDGSAKAIVFSQFTSFLDLINYSLGMSGVSCVQLVGSMARAARDVAINKFNEDPNCKVFLMSLQAGEVALDLTVASHVFMMDPWWKPAAERQALDRIHRIGQCRPVRVVRFIIENTVEERILTLQNKKELLFEGTVGGSQKAIGQLTSEDMRFLFMII